MLLLARRLWPYIIVMPASAAGMIYALYEIKPTLDAFSSHQPIIHIDTSASLIFLLTAGILYYYVFKALQGFPDLYISKDATKLSQKERDIQLGLTMLGGFVLGFLIFGGTKIFYKGAAHFYDYNICESESAHHHSRRGFSYHKLTLCKH